MAESKRTDAPHLPLQDPYSRLIEMADAGRKYLTILEYFAKVNDLKLDHEHHQILTATRDAEDLIRRSLIGGL